MFYKKLYIFITAFSCVFFSANLLFAQENPATEIRETVNQLQSLIKEKQSQGLDISEALELDRQSREAMQVAQPQKCLQLLKEAISLLKEKVSNDNRQRRKRLIEKSLVVDSQRYEDSPFGFHPTYVIPPQEYGVSDPFDFALDLGIKFDRNFPGAWLIVQPHDYSQPDGISKDYDWSMFDNIISNTPNSIKNLANILIETTQTAQQAKISSRLIKGSTLPANKRAYRVFVRNIVERYDGDEDFGNFPITEKVKQAIRDNPIKYWQVGNEPSEKALKDYAKLLRITYEAVKEADPKAKVLIGGVGGFPPVTKYLEEFDQSFLPILSELAEFDGKYFDIFDFHWYGNVTGDYKGVKQVYNHIRQKLMERDIMPQLGFWITEMGTYSGNPGPLPFGERWDPAFASERQHASDLFKRHIYPIAIGIKKIFPGYGLKEGFKYDEGYFDFTGLIYDGKYKHDKGKGVKKLAYYTYKKMVEVLEGSDWDNVETIREKDGIYIYKFIKQGRPIWVAWNDNNKPKHISFTLDKDINDVKITEAIPNYNSGKDVQNYNTAFKEIKGDALESSPAQIKFELGANPVFIEESHKTVDVSKANKFEIEEEIITLKSNYGYRLRVKSVHPKFSKYPAKRFPVVLRLGGGWGTGISLLNNRQTRKAAARGFIIAAFDSEVKIKEKVGSKLRDYNGFKDQDDLATVLKSILNHPNVNTQMVGIWSHSNGITLAAGVLGRQKYQKLSKKVAFLLDDEGPHAPRDILENTDVVLHPKNIKNEWKRVIKAKTGSKHGSVEDFFKERSAINFIGNFRGIYQRVQAKSDHATSKYLNHAAAMLKTTAASKGKSKWTRLNKQSKNQIYTYSENEDGASIESAIDIKKLHGPNDNYTWEILFDLFREISQIVEND